MPRQIGQMLPPALAHLLPVMDRGGAGGDPGLILGDLGRVCLDAVLRVVQVPLGSFRAPVWLAAIG